MNEEEIGALKLLKLKHRRGGWGANNPDFLQNWCRNFERLRKVLLNHTGNIEI